MDDPESPTFSGSSRFPVGINRGKTPGGPLGLSEGNPRRPSCPRCMNGELCLLPQGATMQHGPHWVGDCLHRAILRNLELEWVQPVSHMHLSA